MRHAYEDHLVNFPGIADRHHWLRGTDVQHVWRKHGWVPPSKECADTMRKQKAFREWSAQMGDTR